MSGTGLQLHQSPAVTPREVRDGDLPHFYAHQLDETANRMAAFTVPDPSDRAAFAGRWAIIRGGETILIRN